MTLLDLLLDPENPSGLDIHNLEGGAAAGQNYHWGFILWHGYKVEKDVKKSGHIWVFSCLATLVAGPVFGAWNWFLCPGRLRV